MNHRDSLARERKRMYIERHTKAYLERDRIQRYVETGIDKEREEDFT